MCSIADGKAAQPPERKRKDTNEAYRVYEEIIKDKISYGILKHDLPYDDDRLDEIVDLILATVFNRRSVEQPCGKSVPLLHGFQGRKRPAKRRGQHK